MTRIRSIASALPERRVTNEDLVRENPSWDMAAVTERAGVRTRRVAAPDETSFDLSVRACEELFADSELDPGDVDAILYCTQSPDYLMPGNSNLLHRHLELGDEVLAFDFTLACSGYVYGLAVADSFVRAGLASEILLVTAETYSKYIHPRDRTTRALFGDAAAVTHVSAAGGGGRVAAAALCSSGRDLDKGAYIPGGGMRFRHSEDTAREVADDHGNVRSAEHIHLNGPAVWTFINSTVPRHVRGFLADQGLTMDDVDLCVFHQASKLALDSLAKALGLDERKLFVHMEDIGNVASASIPLALRAALDEGAIQPGSRVLLSAYGAGMSYGSVLVEY